MQQMQMGPMGGMFDAEKAFAAERQQLGLVRFSVSVWNLALTMAFVLFKVCCALAAERQQLGLVRDNSWSDFGSIFWGCCILNM